MKKTAKIFGILSAVSSLSVLIPLIAEAVSDYNFLFGSVDIEKLTAILFSFSAVFLLISTILAVIAKDDKNKVSDYVIRFLQVFLICFFIFKLINDSKDHKYYEFTSPDGKHTVVAEEWSENLSDDYTHGCVMFYVRKNTFFISQKDLCFNTNGYLPISSDGYSIEWNENNMSFTLQNGNNEPETVTIEY